MEHLLRAEWQAPPRAGPSLQPCAGRLPPLFYLRGLVIVLSVCKQLVRDRPPIASLQPKVRGQALLLFCSEDADQEETSSLLSPTERLQARLEAALLRAQGPKMGYWRAAPWQTLSLETWGMPVPGARLASALWEAERCPRCACSQPEMSLLSRRGHSVDKSTSRTHPSHSFPWGSSLFRAWGWVWNPKRGLAQRKETADMARPASPLKRGNRIFGVECTE